MAPCRAFTGGRDGNAVGRAAGIGNGARKPKRLLNPRFHPSSLIRFSSSFLRTETYYRDETGRMRKVRKCLRPPAACTLSHRTHRVRIPNVHLDCALSLINCVITQAHSLRRIISLKLRTVPYKR